jgi:hypothetical protein
MDLYVIKWHLNDFHGDILHYGVYNTAYHSMEEAELAKTTLLNNQEKNWINHWGEDCVYKDADKGVVGVYRFKTTPYYLFLEITKINTK